MGLPHLGESAHPPGARRTAAQGVCQAKVATSTNEKKADVRYALKPLHSAWQSTRRTVCAATSNVLSVDWKTSAPLIPLLVCWPKDSPAAADLTCTGLKYAHPKQLWSLEQKNLDYLAGMQAHQGQESLEKKVALLEAHQKEVHDSLVSMENVALRMYQA